MRFDADPVEVAVDVAEAVGKNGSVSSAVCSRLARFYTHESRCSDISTRSTRAKWCYKRTLMLIQVCDAHSTSKVKQKPVAADETA